LGPADSDHLLRPLRPGGCAGAGPPGAAAPDRGLPSRCDRGEPARAPQRVVLRQMPAVRRAGAARNGRVRHVPRFGLVLPPLPVDRVRRPAVGPDAHQDVAPRHHLHRRESARRTPPALLPARQRGAPGASPGVPPDVARKLHQTIKKVTADTESLDYNTAIAAMMEYVNALRDAGRAMRDAVEPLLVMLAPYAPHLAEELWAVLGHDSSVFHAGWPSYDAKLAAAGDVEVVVQVNGKVRARVTVSRGASEAEVVALAMQDESVRKFVDGKPVRKTIYVQDRLLNFVV